MILNDIRQLAMDFADKSVPITGGGKFSPSWWNRQINYIQSVLAQETGYYMTYHDLSIVANNPTIALPSTLCWGIAAVLYKGNPLTAREFHRLMDEYGSWLDTESGTPSEYFIRGQNLELYPAPEQTCTGAASIASALGEAGVFANQPRGTGTVSLVSSVGADTYEIRIYGTTRNKAELVYEDVTLTGTTAATTTKDDWDYILGFGASDETTTPTGTITLKNAAAATIGTLSLNADIGITAPDDTTFCGSTVPSVSTTDTTGIPVGLVGTDESGNEVLDFVTLGTVASVAVACKKRFYTVDYVLNGAAGSGKTVTVTRGYPLQILAGTLPSDLTSDSSTPTALPAQFHSLLSHGAAAMAEIADIYESQQQARASAHGEAFWRGVEKLKAYLDGMQREREESIPLDTSLGWEHYNN